MSRRRSLSRRGTRASLRALVNPRARGNKLRGMKSLLYHAFGVKGFRCLRTRYEGGETIFEVEPEKEPEVLRRHGYRWRTMRSVSIGLKPVVLNVKVPVVKHHERRGI